MKQTRVILWLLGWTYNKAMHSYLLIFYPYLCPRQPPIQGHVLDKLKLCHVLSNHFFAILLWYTRTFLKTIYSQPLTSLHSGIRASPHICLNHLNLASHIFPLPPYLRCPISNSVSLKYSHPSIATSSSLPLSSSGRETSSLANTLPH